MKTMWILTAALLLTLGLAIPVASAGPALVDGSCRCPGGGSGGIECEVWLAGFRCSWNGLPIDSIVSYQPYDPAAL